MSGKSCPLSLRGSFFFRRLYGHLREKAKLGKKNCEQFK